MLMFTSAATTMAAAAPTMLSSRSSLVLTSRVCHRSTFLTSTSRPSLLYPRIARRMSSTSSPRTPTIQVSASSSPIEVCVKDSITSPGRIGDCPFSQRILLTLEEKHLPYDVKLVDFANKPEWFLGVSPEGKVPVIKLEEKWIADSDVIAQALDEMFPNRTLTTPPEKASVGSKIFSTFIGFLASKDPTDGKEETLISELTVFNDYIKENGPFINGDVISASDLSLGPKMYHMEVALGHYKKWSVPDSLTHVRNYMKTIFSRDSFVKTRALPDDVIAGWSPKFIG